MVYYTPTKDTIEAVGVDTIKATKDKVYDRILEHLKVEGYPMEGDPDFKEVNVNDLVNAIIKPIMFDFICRTGRETIQLRREKEIISTSNETGDIEEFVVLDLIPVTQEKFIFIVEAKQSSLGKAMRQCLLEMNDMRGNNNAGEVYGFVTTGQHWQMFKYDGESFKTTREIMVVFNGMDKKSNLSVLVKLGCPRAASCSLPYYCEGSNTRLGVFTCRTLGQSVRLRGV